MRKKIILPFIIIVVCKNLVYVGLVPILKTATCKYKHIQTKIYQMALMI